MSISAALSSALSGLNVNQENLSVVSGNIANANTEGYSKRSVKQASQNINGVASGVLIESIEREVDTYLLAQKRTQNSQLGIAEIKQEYYEQIQLLYGQPDNNNSLSDDVDEFFSALNLLSGTPESSSLRLDAMEKAKQLTQKINNTSLKLNELQLRADLDLRNTIDSINREVSNIFNINLSIADAISRAQPTTSLVEERDQLLESLAKKIDVNVVQGAEESDLSILTTGGVSLLDSNIYELNYNNAGSLAVFSQGLELNAVTLNAINNSGEIVGNTIDLVSRGTSSTIVNSISGGTFRGLTDIRDDIIPGLIEQLDSLASSLSNSINAIHNKGTGFPARDTITGTKLITANESRDFSGKVRIGLVDSQGNPVDSSYSSENSFGMRPLTLDLSQLDNNDGLGTPDMQTIIDEINYYFGPSQPRASLGNLEDIKIVTTQDSIAAAGGVNFDLELDSLSAFDSSVIIEGVTVTDSLAAGQTVNTPAAFPTTAYDHTAGERSRTGSDLSFNFTGSGNLPYTVTLDVRVDDGQDTDDSVKTGTITYTVTASPASADVRNTRHNPISVTGDATLTAAPGTEERIFAEIVDAEGNVITDGDTEGYLRLRTSNSDLGIVIDSLDSQEEGLATDSSITATNRGFSHYFQLNNFFDEEDETSVTALNLSIRDDISETVTNLSTASYKIAADAGITGVTNYTYVVSKGDNTNIKELADLKESLIAFDAAGGIPNTTTSFSSFATILVSYVGSQKTFVDNDAAQEVLLKDQLDQAFTSGSGVNLDEELANTIIFQRAYTASARMITVIDEILEALINAV